MTLLLIIVTSTKTMSGHAGLTKMLQEMTRKLI